MTMPAKEAAKVLRVFNAWRTDKNVPASVRCPSVRDITVAIDAAVAALENTTPADAALADELDSVASELATYQSDNAATVSRAAAALRARAVPEADVRDSLISGCAKPCWCDKCHAAMRSSLDGHYHSEQPLDMVASNSDEAKQ